MFVSVLLTHSELGENKPEIQIESTSQLDSIVSWMPWLESLKGDTKKFCAKVLVEDLPTLRKSVSVQEKWQSGEILKVRLATLTDYVSKNCKI